MIENPESSNHCCGLLVSGFACAPLRRPGMMDEVDVRHHMIDFMESLHEEYSRASGLPIRGFVFRDDQAFARGALRAIHIIAPGPRARGFL